MTDRLLRILRDRLDASLDALPEIVAAVLLFLVFYLIGRALSMAVQRLIGRARNAERYTLLARRLVRWTFGGIGLVLALQLLGLTAVATSLLATGGFVAVVLGFAFREIGENLLAGLFLGMSRSFEVGDLIESSGHTGTVREIELRHVHVRSADGKDIFIPSAQIFRNVLVNFTRDRLRRPEFTVGIDYGDPPDRARAVLLEALRDTEGVLEQPAPEVQLSGFTPQYQELRALFWVRTGGSPTMAEIRTAVMEQALRRLREEGFRLSSEVSSAVEMAPVEVRLEGRHGTGDDTPPTDGRNEG